MNDDWIIIAQACFSDGNAFVHVCPLGSRFAATELGQDI